MNDGSLDQPFYYSQSTQRWTKLTYGHKKLDLAVKVNGELATLGSEATIDGGHESTSTSVAVRSQLMVEGSYDFVGDGLVLKMTFSFSALTPLSDVKVWLGTSDDWIGEDDRPAKETGDFDHGFVPSKGGKILRVQSGKEEVFAFSPNAGSKAIILQHYGNWPRVYASDQSDVSRSSSDGAYAIYVPLGSIEVGQTKEATIFYAASGANQLEKLAVVSEEADEVAETAESGTTATTATAATATTAATAAVSTTTAPGMAVLKTDFLKIAVMEDGSLGQPFYFSSQRAPHLDLGTGQVENQQGGWTKLTYGNKQLDSAIKVDGHLAHLSGGSASSASSAGQESQKVWLEFVQQIDTAKNGWKGYSEYSSATRQISRKCTPITEHGDFHAAKRWNPLTSKTENELKEFVANKHILRPKI
ncbi:unnamed protein product [Cladocopium goreaui]|nr:unnamed protein product [Cladocopium goreaui]